MTLDQMRIFVGVEQKIIDDVVGVVKDDGTVGAYGFPHWSGNGNDSVPSILKGETPLMRFRTGTGYHTARSITCHNHKVYSVTRDTFYADNEKGDKRIFEKQLLDFFTDTGKKSEAERIINKSSLKTGVVPNPSNGLLFYLYLKRAEDNSSEKQAESPAEGYLFYSPSENLDDFRLVPNLVPTGAPIPIGNHKLIVPSGKNLEMLVLSKDSYSRDKKWTMRPLEREILALSALEELALCTDSLRGYTLIDLKQMKSFPSPKNRESFKHQNLPSEATSCALTKYNSKEYALFGADGGKLLVYEVIKEKEECSLKYINTVTFLSLESSIRDIGKGNNIHGIKVDSGSYVHFTLRNLYLRIGMPRLLDLERGVVIPVDDEKKKPLEYIQALIKTYHLGQVCWVPHRVSDYDFLKK